MIVNDIDDLLNVGISIIKKEIDNIATRQALQQNLTKTDFDSINEYMRTLIAVRKDYRIAEKEFQLDTKKLSNEELEKMLLDEAAKILKV